MEAVIRLAQQYFFITKFLSVCRHSRVFLVSTLCLVYLLPGLVGHDPWKQDEAYGFGVIYHIFQTGDLVVPTLAGEPFMEKPPLYYICICAAFLGHLLSGWLPLHDAARLTTGVFMTLVVSFTGLAAKELLGKGLGLFAVLILISCLGLVDHAHEMITDMSLLAGFAIASYGLALSVRENSVITAGLALGTGLGISFMSKGFIGPAMLGLTALALPIFFRNWRTKNYFRCLGIAFVAALPWLVVWPYALYRRSPDLFMEWFWVNNIGRYVGFADLGADTKPWHYLQTLPWFAFPAWLLALPALWYKKLDLLRERPFQLLVTVIVTMLSILATAATARHLYALPVLIPLSILAASAVRRIPGAVSEAFAWFSILLFGGLAVGLWAVWGAMMAKGSPPVLPGISGYLPSDFKPVFMPGPFLLAAGLSLTWIVSVYAARRYHSWGLISWCCGVTLAWGLIATLWLPWLDDAKSYRTMIISMQHALPRNFQCVSSVGLGEPQRGMLEYVAGVVTYRNETRPKDCPLLLVQDDPTSPDDAKEKVVADGRWTKIWEGGRPGDTRERYRLFGRES